MQSEYETQSPRRNCSSNFDGGEQSSEEMQMISISSPRRIMSPRKRSVAEAVLNSPAKNVPASPCKKLLDSPRQSPRKKALNDACTNSPGKNMSASFDGSPRKRVPFSNIAFSSEGPLRSISSPKKKSETRETGVVSPRKKDVPSIKNTESEFDPIEEVQLVLRERISQRNTPPRICGYEKERKQLFDLIKRTAMTGESNSMLLIGPRGCGKTMLIKDVLNELFTDEKIKKDLMHVQLNGLLQSDDRIALREITRQLQLENTVGDKVFGSFAETLQFLLDALKKGDQGSKPTLFILDDFDLFAQHRNQTLLYNLFDIAQSAQAPICVIGITCRLDVIELLEKRVKSRFSHRQLHLFNKLTLTQYTQLCQDYLSLPEDFKDATFRKAWNENIKNLVEEVSVKDVLERQFHLMNDVRGLLSLLTYPVCCISSSHPTITAGDIISSFKLTSTDTKSAMLHGVSILELAIIIAMKHLTDIYEGEPFNFEMVYSEYLKFARHKSGMQVYEKAIVMKAYEHLQTLELIRSTQGGVGNVGGTGQKEYRLMNLLVHPAQIMDALQKYPNCPTEIKQWATQSIS